ncbi:MAG TPA: HD domain-containing phosphohydrolase [bacterium]|nr:HD domain-containing phosphohydrolase [bacterium]
MAKLKTKSISTKGLQEQILSLNRIGIALSEQHSLNELLELILTESREFTNAEAGSLYVREENQLRFALSQNEVLEKRARAREKKEGVAASKSFSGFYLSLDKSSLAGYVGVTGKILNIPDAYKIPKGREYKFNSSFDEKNNYHTKSMLMVPLKDSSGNAVGVLQLINARKGKTVVPFSKHFETLALSLASQAAVSIKNTVLAEELKEAYLDTIFRLSVAAEYKDDDTAVHIQRMSQYSAILAEGLGLSKTEVENIRFASPMHDIGKLGVPDSILLKPAKLTAEEFKEMQNHTLIGGKILENAKSEILKVSEQIAVTHHEKWDGSGYPHGLAGEHIPLYGRIVALADVFDALTTKRCYKPAFSMDETLHIIKEGTGRHFDPTVVAAFDRNMDKIMAVKNKFSN